ncbi:5-formyltetrahydrofolate cyclo-ligase [Leptolyngbya cf. ectocarpi LEGE 11479]|uniref:5-formyltetrahydrofolate cyclo-ligase n=1 Tax=Leptolyngbya cf. ectocarpi LEGE 11479 TaxID=1828722 RepID=A0A928ZPD8_LEPEC|nr:5-formyltetrahydrofolate cyclo-ligase [Leptolyngbya ectocarpi]MBE9065080.1 5-formyltetrahydrofolate cyclo-ligase [Leptolyngbya cf. ectocarpi LEGE 11479]
MSVWSGRHSGKDDLRQRIWSILKNHHVTHRDPVGHIPNFIGADMAAGGLAATKLWQCAQVVKCNPDSPQSAVRLRALTDGKTLYMAVPRLSRKKCFVELTAMALKTKGVALEDAASMKGAMVHGRLVAFEEMHPIDLVIVGCVAVSANGGRTGKGAGFADLELAMLRACKLIAADTPIATTVHDLQIVAAAELPMQQHDWGLDLIVTPTRSWTTEHSHPRPTGLDWDTIQPDQIANIPILQAWFKRRC